MDKVYMKVQTWNHGQGVHAGPDLEGPEDQTASKGGEQDQQGLGPEVGGRSGAATGRVVLSRSLATDADGWTHDEPLVRQAGAADDVVHPTLVAPALTRRLANPAMQLWQHNDISNSLCIPG